MKFKILKTNPEICHRVKIKHSVRFPVKYQNIQFTKYVLLHVIAMLNNLKSLTGQLFYFLLFLVDL